MFDFVILWIILRPFALLFAPLFKATGRGIVSLASLSRVDADELAALLFGAMVWALVCLAIIVRIACR